MDDDLNFGRHVIDLIGDVTDLTADEKIDLVEISDEVINLQVLAMQGKDIELSLDLVTDELKNIAPDKAVSGSQLMQNALTGFLAKALLNLNP